MFSSSTHIHGVPNTELLCEEQRVSRDTKYSQSGLSAWQWDESHLQVSDWTCTTSSIQCIMYLLNNEIQQLKREMTIGKASKWSSISGRTWENINLTEVRMLSKWKEHCEQGNGAWGRTHSTFGDNHVILLAEIHKSTAFRLFSTNRIQTTNSEHTLILPAQHPFSFPLIAVFWVFFREPILFPSQFMESECGWILLPPKLGRWPRSANPPSLNQSDWFRDEHMVQARQWGLNPETIFKLFGKRNSLPSRSDNAKARNRKSPFCGI